MNLQNIVLFNFLLILKTNINLTFFYVIIFLLLLTQLDKLEDTSVFKKSPQNNHNEMTAILQRYISNENISRTLFILSSRMLEARTNAAEIKKSIYPNIAELSTMKPYTAIKYSLGRSS